MKKIYISISLLFTVLSGYSQLRYNCLNYNYLPRIDATSGGIWKEWSRTIETDSTQSGYPDSVYVDVAGLPNYGDLKTFDLELKMKSLWYKDSLFFLFQRLDDTYVNGLDSEGQHDNSVAEGLDNLDATKIYFYLSTDSLRLRDTTYEYSDSIAWLQFVWKSEEMSGRLPSGEIVNNYDDFHSKTIQWCEGGYCYAKFGIDMSKIAPYLMESVRFKMNEYGVGGIGFMLETSDNDKEVKSEDDLYIIQTRAFWGSSIDSDAESKVNKWHWMAFFQDSSNFYTTPVFKIQEQFASIYPQPAYNYINIQLEEYDVIDYSVYDIMGRQIISGNFNGTKHSIPVENLEPGTYIIRMKNRKGEFMSLKTLKL